MKTFLNCRVWDYHSSYKLCEWRPDLRSHSLDLSYKSTPHISAVELINSHDVTLVLAGFNDGNVQVWSQCVDGPPKLVTGWHGLPICKNPSFESSSSKYYCLLSKMYFVINFYLFCSGFTLGSKVMSFNLCW